MRRFAVLTLLVLALSAPMTRAETLQENNEILLQQLATVQRLSAAQIARLREIFAKSGIIGQGNPAVTRHPMTPAECAARIPGGVAAYSNPKFERICGGKYMVPLYDPATQRPEQATACIDQFEFPDIPCAYPVVWTSAREAEEICAAEGKRICDAHEWEGACQGEVLAPDYNFSLARGVSLDAAVERMRAAHNKAVAATARWSYGPAYQEGICGTGSSKTPGCNGGSWSGCGSNTYPAGSFPN